jgi:hypothetical protein
MDLRPNVRRLYQAYPGIFWAAAIPCWVLAFMFSFIAYNALDIYLNRDGYRPGTFIVTDATVTHFTKGYVAHLIGTIDGQRENYTPDGFGLLHTRAEILPRFPIGSALAVKYNSTMTRTFIQGQAQRVIAADYDHQADLRFVGLYAGILLLPSLFLAWVLYVGFPRTAADAPVRRTHPGAGA